jgi:hypothetical protein
VGIAERDIFTGDMAEIFIISKAGVQKIILPLRSD